MQVCLPAGCIDAIRVSLVDDCTDLPIYGTSSGYVFNCFRNVELTTNVEEGTETILRNSCGKKCFQTRQPDELTNIGLSFELLNPDYELTALLTGQSLINDGVENIGWYQQENSGKAPYVCVEMFEQVPDESCAAGHRYRRLVIPKIKFRLPENAREEPFRIVPFSGLSAAASLASWADGPFHDSPFDFSSIGSAQTHYMEFFDDTITDTLEGNCGFLSVEDVDFEVQAEAFFTTAFPDLVGSFAQPTSQAMLTEQGSVPGTGGYCGPVGVMYSCAADDIVFWSTNFTQFDPANANRPAYVDLVTDTGLHQGIAVEDHYTNSFTVSLARIHNASSYGTHIFEIRFKDGSGNVLCSLKEPYGSWNGAEWLIGDPICSGPVPPANPPHIINVVVTP